eukprot:TRINITY_DN6556_c0_g2_i4.p1 TRINITY_DN6556_c0_g2~~TRINITY_DN6556_c0_g2_i4.p1  ORF type:complete len:411 (+),score=117.77 TRINITY_DN6556_c0_g2_i4:86-1318(+)
MTFALIFLILLSFLLICGALLIWKSDLPDNDKIISIISLMGLFCVVSIINEFKRGPVSRVAVFDFEVNFFSLKETEDPSLYYKLPVLKSHNEYINENLRDLKILGPDSLNSIILVEGEAKIGKSFAFKTLAKELHHKGYPALYLELRNDKLDVNNILRPQNLESLEETIEKFNAKGKTPLIIIDSVEKAFASENKLSPYYCQICESLKDVFDHKKVNIILITNQIEVREKLLLNTGFYRRVVVRRFEQYRLDAFKAYAVNDVNSMITQESKKFNENNAELFYRRLGFNFGTINEYIKSSANTVEEFVDEQLNNFKGVIEAHRNLHDLFAVMLDSLYDKTNRQFVNDWIPIGRLKRSEVKDLAEKLDSAISYGYVDYENGHYRFRNHLVLNAAILSLNKHKLTEVTIKDSL